MGMEGPPVRRRRRMGREPVGRGKECPEARLSLGGEANIRENIQWSVRKGWRCGMMWTSSSVFDYTLEKSQMTIFVLSSQQ